MKLRRGISLIEALVAMAVMAFGMLGVVGMQATLRANGDLAKQRSEAVRIAQEQIEIWRRFSVLENDAEHPAADFPHTYATSVASSASAAIVGYTTNTTYIRTGTVTPAPGATPKTKTMAVDVQWADRGGTTHNVRLFSAVAGIAPEFSATLVTPPTGGLARAPGGRHRGIPPGAMNFGDGTSGYRPPGQGVGSGVAWLFNNATGLITGVCTTTVIDNSLLVPSALTGCVSTTPHLLLAGYVRFFESGTQPTANDLIDPSATLPAVASGVQVRVQQTAPSSATVDCFEGTASTYIEYFCAVPLSAGPPAVLLWSGALEIDASPPLNLAANLSVSNAAQHKVCRYRAAATYANVEFPLANENLVLINAGDGAGNAFACPAPNTWAHQPAS